MSTGLPQWVYRIVPTRPEMVTDATDDEVAVIAAHFQYLLALKERGDLILAGRTQEAVGTWGVTIFEAPDEEAARAIMEGDPAVASGIVSAELRPFHVSLLRGRD